MIIHQRFLWFQVSLYKPGCMEVLCTTYQCILEEKAIAGVIEGEEKSIYTWKASNHTDFWRKTLEEGINGKLGADKPDMMVTVKVWLFAFLGVVLLCKTLFGWYVDIGQEASALILFPWLLHILQDFKFNLVGSGKKDLSTSRSFLILFVKFVLFLNYPIH